MNLVQVSELMLQFCGVKIGKRSMVAAGSVVIKNVGENELVAGNPAKFKKEIKKWLIYL